MIGKAKFFAQECLNKYITLSASKPLPIHLVDHDEFDEGFELESLFEFQNTLSFLTLKYRKHYPTIVMEFYANLLTVEDDPIFKCCSMVCGITFEFDENDINDILNYHDEDIDPSGLIDLVNTQATIRIGSYKRKTYLIKDELIHTMLKEDAKFNAKKCKLYASNLIELPHLIAIIVTYNFYPHKNHTELTNETLYIIYRIVQSSYPLGPFHYEGNGQLQTWSSICFPRI